MILAPRHRMRQRRCGSCAASWERTARWCGHCGAPLVVLDEPQRRTLANDRLVAVVAAVIGVGVVTTAILAGDRTVALQASVLAPTAGGPAPADDPAQEEVIVEPTLRAPAPRQPTQPQPVPLNLDAGTCDPSDATGACVRWRVELANDQRTALRVTRGVLISVDDTGGIDVRSAATGEIRWQARIDADPGTVLLPTVGSILPVSAQGNLRLFDLASGAELGTTQGVAPVDAVATEAGLLTVEDQAIRARAVTGTLLWQREILADERPVLTDAAAYLISAEQQLTRVFTTTGQNRWQRDLGGRIGTLVASGGGVVVHLTGPDELLVGLDARGNEVWTVALDGQLSHLVADERTIAATISRGGSTELLVLDPQTGEARGQVSLPGVNAPPPVLTADRIVVAHGQPLPGLTIVRARDATLDSRLPLREGPTELWARSPDEVAAVVPSSGSRPPGRSVVVVGVDPGQVLWRTLPSIGIDIVAASPLVVANRERLIMLEPDAEL